MAVTLALTFTFSHLASMSYKHIRRGHQALSSDSYTVCGVQLFHIFEVFHSVL